MYYLTSLQRPYVTTNISIDQSAGIYQLKPVLTTGLVNTHTDGSFADLAFRYHGNKSKCLMLGGGLLNIYIKFCKNTCSEIAIKTNFHFSHYKSLETLSCHSNERT